MKPAFFIPSLLSLALLTSPLFAASTPPSQTSDFSAALADFRAEWKRSSVTTVQSITEMSEAFFSRVNLDTLSEDELAMVLEVVPFKYGEKAKEAALATTRRMTPLVAEPTTNGALAAALRNQLAGPADIPGDLRKVWASEYLEHPSFIPLVQGKHGDLALTAACRAVRTDAEKERFLALAGKLDAAQSISAARSVREYWDRIKQIVPESERRQTLRVQLVNYLKAAIAVLNKDNSHSASPREALEQHLALLDGPQARGELINHPAPEIEFIWSSHDGWKRLSDVRGTGGKVVVLDFWATWCGPCVESFPHMRELVEHYRGHDVEIVGVTSLQGTVVGLRAGTANCKGDPEKEKRLMADYIKEREITWPIVISRENVFNPNYGVQGIPTMTIIAPDGTVRHSASGFSLEETKKRIDALLGEFQLGLPTPRSQEKR